MSDYEEAIEKLKKLETKGRVINWDLHTQGLHGIGGKLRYFCTIGWGIAFEVKRVFASGGCALDAACFAIDQFRNSLLKEEEEKKCVPTWIGTGNTYRITPDEESRMVNLPPASEGRGMIIKNKDYTPLTIAG